MAIATTLARQRELSQIQVAQVYALTAIAMFDAFVACWDEKYTHVRIRPETVINRYIDPKWQPFLETLAFPEYVSGHSAISAAAGQVIAHLVGPAVAFTDSTEQPYGHGFGGSHRSKQLIRRHPSAGCTAAFTSVTVWKRAPNRANTWVSGWLRSCSADPLRTRNGRTKQFLSPS